MRGNSLRALLIALACGPAAIAQAPDAGIERQRLDFFVGEWIADGRTFPEKHGARAGTARGVASYRWVNRDTWLLADVRLEPDYGVTIMVSTDPATGGYRAWAMNNFSATAVSYAGRWKDDTTLVFEGALDAEGRRLQRVTYERRADGSIHFRAEESGDGGVTYAPDSELVLRRRPQ
jgi:hypothetical protein